MKRRFGIFAGLLAILLLVCWMGCGCTEKYEEEKGAAPSEEHTEEPPDESPDAAATFRETTICYLSDEGFIVPVTKLIPWETGIAKAALSYMVSTPVNLSAAREMGLRTVIPDGVQLSLSIADGNALVDIAELNGLPDRETEDAMIRAIVNTLTEFPTVSTVTITRDGRGGTLENGAELPVRRGAYPLNPEEPELSASAGEVGVKLYFPNRSGALTIPVTRRLGDDPGIYSTVASLISGPESNLLRSCFPENTLLLGAAIENRTVTVNLSEDFKAVEQTEGMFSLAYKSLFLTLAERYGMDTLKIQVNGSEYAPEPIPDKMLNPAAR